MFVTDNKKEKVDRRDILTSFSWWQSQAVWGRTDPAHQHCSPYTPYSMLLKESNSLISAAYTKPHCFTLR